MLQQDQQSLGQMATLNSMPHHQTHSRDNLQSARSTPFSSTDTQAKRTPDELRSITWPQTYSLADSSTVFHTSTTSSNHSAYYGTTYQQAVSIKIIIDLC